MRRATPVRFRAADGRQVALLCLLHGEGAGHAAVADPAPLRIRRPRPKQRNRKKP